MLGTASVKQWVKKSVEIGNVLLHVEALSLPGRLSNISFHVKEGEVVGIAGLVGAGKTGALPKYIWFRAICERQRSVKRQEIKVE